MSAFAVSVVIPLYNKARFIRATLETALAQTHRADEIIIVDDSSTDGSVAGIEDFLGECVRLVRQANAGPGPARNRGVAEANSEWIAFLDADDLWQANHLATLAEVAAQCPDAAVVAARHRRLAATDPVPAPDNSPGAARRIDFFRDSQQGEIVQTSALAIRRATLIEAGGFGAFFPGEDFELWTRLALDHAIAVSDRTTALYVQHTGGLMDSLTGRKSFKPEHQPMFALLAEALADPRYAWRHRDIRALRDGLLRNSVKQELYRGDADAARILIHDCDRLGAAVPASYRALAMLPQLFLGPAIRTAVRLRRFRSSTGQARRGE